MIDRIFTSSEQVAACSDCSQLGNSPVALCLLLPVQPGQAVPEHSTKSLAIGFAVKNFTVHCLLEHPLGVIAM